MCVFIAMFCNFMQVTGISQHHMATASGLNDYDYQNLSNLTMGLKNVNQLELISKIPVPPEIMEHYNSKLAKSQPNSLGMSQTTQFTLK